MVTFSISNEKLTCSFSERQDTEKCMEYGESIYEKVQESKIPVIFDLKKVQYISSMFLSICLRIFREVGAQNFSIINVQPNVKKVFKIAGLDKMMTIQ